MNNRLVHLDGLRGLAILLVVGYHGFYRWSEIMPFGYKYADIFIFEFGWLGVQLFFLISGFVITMSFERCPSFLVFLFKRWLRLFPAMFAATVFVYVTAFALPERPVGRPSIIDTLPGLLFVEPIFLGKIFNLPVSSLEGAFWSLYVEVKFYIFAAVFYYWFHRRFLYIYFISAFFAYQVLDFGSSHLTDPVLEIAYSVAHYASFKYFGWFAAGSASFYYFHTNDKKWLYHCVFASLASCLFLLPSGIDTVVFAILVSIIFVATMMAEPLQKLLSSRLLVYFGFISYPLYLIHENLIVSLTIKLNRSFLMDYSPISFILALIFVIVVAYVIARFIEPILRAKLMSFQSRLIKNSL